MKRKIVRHGPSSLTITLPMKWALENKLKPGDEITLNVEQDKIIVFASEPVEKQRMITLNYDFNDELPRRLFAMPYIRGYDVITIGCKNPHMIDFIEKNMYVLTGFEIVGQTASSITVQNILKVDPKNFLQIFERMFNVAISMVKELSEDFRTGNFENLELIAKYESLLNKLDFYSRRVLNLYRYEQKEMTNSVYLIVRELESMSDIVRNCIERSKREEFVKNAAIAHSLALFAELLSLNHKLFFSRNMDLVFAIKKKELEYVHSIATIKGAVTIPRFLVALFQPIHHISEDAL